MHRAGRQQLLEPPLVPEYVGEGIFFPRGGENLNGNHSYFHHDLKKLPLHRGTRMGALLQHRNNPWMKRVHGAKGRDKSRGRVNVAARQMLHW